jgi:hypothetical protein
VVGALVDGWVASEGVRGMAGCVGGGH